MRRLEETEISKAILTAYHQKLADRIVSDVLIVGAGPAGLSASLHARQAGMRFVTLDKEPDIGGTVRHYPRKKLVMTSPVKVPGFGRIRCLE